MIERNDEPKQAVDALTMLQEDHRKVEELFATYESAGDFATKQQIASHVFAALARHAQLEAQVFYPAYAAQAGKDGTQLVADSRLEHETIKALMIELQGLDLEAEEFEAKFTELMDTVQHHVDEEEQEMFPEAAQILADQLDDLLVQMVDLKQQRMLSKKQ
jgi:hemerythrin-like domain-containing protein